MASFCGVCIFFFKIKALLYVIFEISRVCFYELANPSVRITAQLISYLKFFKEEKSKETFLKVYGEQLAKILELKGFLNCHV